MPPPARRAERHATAELPLPEPFASDFTDTPYWWEAVPRPALAQAALPARADVAVIGSGYTGLHAALVTARAGRHTVVLDAGDAGWGCSTRNGGQVSTSIKPDLDGLAKHHGIERARAIHAEGHRALAWLGGFLEREGIECDFRVCGRFHAAHTPAAYERLARSVERQVAGLETDARVVPRAGQHEEIGTDAYHGGVVYPRHASLDPARYHQGLLQRAVAGGAQVHPHCAVTGIAREGNGCTLSTARGTVHARDVVIATNGYTGAVTPWHRRRVVPIGSYVIATEPLPPAVMDALLPTDRVISDSRRVVYYYRPSPDRTRILFGGRVSLRETDPRVSGPLLHADLVRLFPGLRGVRISHSWMGLVAYTFDTLAHSGSDRGLHYAMGYCGSGVSMAGWLGMRAGQRVLGLAEGRTALDDIPFPTRPLYTGNPWFLAASVWTYRCLDRLGW